MKTIIKLMCILCIASTVNAQDQRREPVKSTPMPNQHVGVPPARTATSTAPMPNQKVMTEEQVRQQRNAHSNQNVSTPENVVPKQKTKMVANTNVAVPVPEGTVIPKQATRQPQPRKKDVIGKPRTK